MQWYSEIKSLLNCSTIHIRMDDGGMTLWLVLSSYAGDNRCRRVTQRLPAGTAACSSCELTNVLPWLTNGRNEVNETHGMYNTPANRLSIQILQRAWS